MQCIRNRKFLYCSFYICSFTKSYLWRYFIDCAVSCETDTKFFFELTRRSFTMVKFFSSQLLDDTCESVSRGKICWKSSFLLVLLIRFLPYFQISAKPIPSVQRLYSEGFMFALIEYFLLFTASCSLYRLSVPNLHIK